VNQAPDVAESESTEFMLAQSAGGQMVYFTAENEPLHHHHHHRLKRQHSFDATESPAYAIQRNNWQKAVMKSSSRAGDTADGYESAEYTATNQSI
jgi:hypothetical protein